MEWIVQITDPHVGDMKKVGDREVDTSAGFERAIAHVNALAVSPKAVLVTGDLVAQETADHYRACAEILSGLSCPYYVIPGNHDDRDLIRTTFGAAGYLDLAGSFIHYSLDDLPLRIIALDSHNPGEVGGRLCVERLSWLEARLSERPSQPTILAIHHPPMDIGIAFFDTIGLENPEPLAAILARNPQVKAVLCGHVHRPIAALWAGCLVVVTPSSGYQYALTLPADQMIEPVVEPPACRLIGLNDQGAVVSHLSYLR